MDAPDRHEVTALVTGASGDGIGRAVAIELAGTCDRVVLVARRRPALDETAALVADAGGVPRVERVDLTDRAAVDDMVARLEREGWPTDILVNNAADLTLGDALGCHDDVWDRSLEVNVTAPFRLSRALAPGMASRGFGRIVNITSVAAERALPGGVAYAVSKAGLVHLSRLMALELAEANVTVNAVSLGPVMTDAMRAVHTPRSREWLISKVPARRMGRPSEVARIVGVLAAPESGFITGQVWAVDGGAGVG